MDSLQLKIKRLIDALISPSQNKKRKKKSKDRNSDKPLDHTRRSRSSGFDDPLPSLSSHPLPRPPKPYTPTQHWRLPWIWWWRHHSRWSLIHHHHHHHHMILIIVIMMGQSEPFRSTQGIRKGHQMPFDQVGKCSQFIGIIERTPTIPYFDHHLLTFSLLFISPDFSHFLDFLFWVFLGFLYIYIIFFLYGFKIQSLYIWLWSMMMKMRDENGGEG